MASSTADRLETFNVTVPAGTTTASPQRTSLSFNDGIVVEFEFRVPPGPSGLVAFQIDYNGTQVIPAPGGPAIVTDNEIVHWPVRNYPSGGGWEFVASNLDIFDHAVEIRVYLQELPTPQQIPVAPEPIPAPGPATEAEGLAELAAEGEIVDLTAGVAPIPGGAAG